MIAIGSVLTLPGSGKRLVVRRMLGEGSQGVVFDATDDSGAELAVKWYYPHTATEAQRRAIALLVERGAPSDRFLWPTDLVHKTGVEGFGYVMPLRPQRCASLTDLLIGKADVPFRGICRLCLELAHGFLLLHSEGLCYRDISFSNVFFDPADGLPLICDNDNVGVDGASPIAVLGTRRFMAPEIVRREAMPSIQTDLYSLAVLLFYVLMMGHPLLGRRELEFECWDDHAESMLFGKDACFIFDPNDESNRPMPDLHATVIRYWRLYPEFVRSLFIQAFTRGLADPKNGRVRESVWRVALVRLHDSVVDCPGCGRQNFVTEDGPSSCWSCGRGVRAEAWCDLDGFTIALGRGARIMGHHLSRNYDFNTVVAEATAHPQNEQLLGLKNCSGRAWSVRLPNGETAIVEPGRTVRVVPDVEIDLGPARAVLR